jgi:hypothetical protein
MAGGALGCGGGDDAQSTTTGVTGLATIDGGDDGDGGSGDDADGGEGGTRLDQMPATTGGDGDGDTGECAAVGQMTELVSLPVDILFAIDTSGSMDDEIGFTQAAMNSFSQQIFLANIDSHVVMISEASPNGVCIAVPLGSGNCPDDANPPGYEHVFTTVASTNAWAQILGTHAQWSPNFREGSVLHVVVISDDESSMSVSDFDAAFKALHPMGGYDDYVFHAIVAFDDPDPLQCLTGNYCCDGALDPLGADVGQRYIDLASQTGGVAGDLCLQEFGPVFDQIAMAVQSTTPLSCEWEIPEPPDGQTFDPGLVNVEFDLDGAVETLGWVPSEFQCGAGDGWYYYPDNVNPTEIRLCPATCTRVQMSTDASMQILFGCDTVPVD